MKSNINPLSLADTADKIKSVILVVDDNEDILDFISDDLSPQYHILCATNGLEALQILENDVVHLVISDVVMPIMDGFKLCATMKASVELSHIPIILLTAINTLQSKIDGLEHGADAYVEKPFSPQFLQVQIANLLRNRDQLKTYFSNSPMVHMKTSGYSKADEIFLDRIQKIINQNLNKPELNVEHLAENLNMSRPTLYRKVKSISDLTPNELINLTRLKRTAELLREGQFKIYEISEIVGYSSQTQLGRNFQRHFGMSPSEYTQSFFSQ